MPAGGCCRQPQSGWITILRQAVEAQEMGRQLARRPDICQSRPNPGASCPGFPGWEACAGACVAPHLGGAWRSPLVTILAFHRGRPEGVVARVRLPGWRMVPWLVGEGYSRKGWFHPAHPPTAVSSVTARTTKMTTLGRVSTAMPVASIADDGRV